MRLMEKILNKIWHRKVLGEIRVKNKKLFGVFFQKTKHNFDSTWNVIFFNKAKIYLFSNRWFVKIADWFLIWDNSPEICEKKEWKTEKRIKRGKTFFPFSLISVELSQSALLHTMQLLSQIVFYFQYYCWMNIVIPF